MRNGKADDAEILKTGRKTLVCGNFCINAAGGKLKFVELLSENLREAEVELNFLSCFFSLGQEYLYNQLNKVFDIVDLPDLIVY